MAMAMSGIFSSPTKNNNQKTYNKSERTATATAFTCAPEATRKPPHWGRESAKERKSKDARLRRSASIP
ncbi:uncharacterized protein DMAD_04620 [Drosophila madeirensis]|uniref:Uncharacterized protein n=1 Tax=Drosophila madeirensis TaxID=30013 RepID=A0AAU9GE60_DROMD